MNESLEPSNPNERDHFIEIGTGRLEAFSDGVMAVIITIMVLGIAPPKGGSLADLEQLIPAFLIYVLSFLFVGIYWNNHHHLLRAAQRISGTTMWANLFLLFWLSLIPFATAWAREQWLMPLPAFFYGAIGLMAGVAYRWVVSSLLAVNKDSGLERAIGPDYKGWSSLGLYLAGMVVSLFTPWLAYVAYAIVSVMWFIPDRRLARANESER